MNIMKKDLMEMLLVDVMKIFGLLILSFIILIMLGGCTTTSKTVYVDPYRDMICKQYGNTVLCRKRVSDNSDLQAI